MEDEGLAEMASAPCPVADAVDCGSALAIVDGSASGRGGRASPSVAGVLRDLRGLPREEAAEVLRLFVLRADGERGETLRSGARKRRGAPQPGDVVSPTRAARALPWRDSDALRWLRERGLVAAGPGDREAVVWGRVLDELSALPRPRGDQAPSRPIHSGRVAGPPLRRVKL